MTYPAPGSQEWLDLVVEEVVDPDRPIVDPHHHLWPPGGALPYGLEDLLADIRAGHSIVRTVFVECGSSYDHSAPAHLKSLGETRFVAGESARDPGHLIGGIVAAADLRRAALAMRWLRESARKRSEKSMAQRLANELLEASEGRGGAMKKRDEVHRMAEANKAFSHFRF